jgi:uncharacterized protein
MIEKVTRVGQLYDFYSALLTDRQRQMIELYYFDDLSLAEMAEQFGISRQAIHDNIRRAEEQMEAYEEALHLLYAHTEREKALGELLEVWNAEMASISEPAKSRIQSAIDKLQAVHRL